MASSPGGSGSRGPKNLEVLIAKIGRNTAVITAVTAVVTLIGAIVAVVHVTGQPSSAPPPSVTAIAAPTALPCKENLVITSPRPGQHVTGHLGAHVTGTACDLASRSGWLFDHDSEDPYYYEVFPDSPGPVVRQDGKWSTIDQPVGGPGDVDKKYFLTLVLASTSCDNALRQLQPTDQDYQLLGFPPGCRIVADVPITVTY